MGKLKNKLIDEQDTKIIEAEKQEADCEPVRDSAEIAADDEARYQAMSAVRLACDHIGWTGAVRPCTMMMNLSSLLYC